MSVPGSEQLEQLVADYRGQFEQLDVVQRGLREISCTVVSPRRAVSVTVGHGWHGWHGEGDQVSGWGVQADVAG